MLALLLYLLIISLVQALTSDEISLLNQLRERWHPFGWDGSPNCTAGNSKCSGPQNCNWPYITTNENNNICLLEIRQTIIQQNLPGPFPNLAAMIGLNYLLLNGINLEGHIDPSVCQLPLQKINLYNNSLTQIPSCLMYHPNLFDIEIGNNYLEGIPELEWRNYTSRLQGLILNDNNMTGSIPSYLVNYPLTKIDLSYNQLSGVIPDIFSMGTLGRVNLENNKLSGYIPTSINKCPLMYLHISYNQLLGFEDIQFGQPLSNTLSVLLISNNNIYETEQLYYLRLLSIFILDISYNQLTSLPSPMISLFRFVTFINMRFNQFNCTIPQDVLNAPNLNYLDLSNNNFNGTIQPSFNPDSFIETVYLNNNPNLGGNNITLPSYLSYDTSDTKNYEEGHFTCYQIIFQSSRTKVIALDDTYTNYQGCYCMIGYYGRPPNCKLCLDGGICPLLSSNENDEIITEEGSMSWHEGYYPWPFSVQTNQLEAFLHCPFHEGCNPEPRCYYNTTTITSLKGECENLCAPGYQNRLCSQCQENYYYTVEGCEECGSDSKREFIIIVLTIAIPIVIGLFALLQRWPLWLFISEFIIVLVLYLLGISESWLLIILLVLVLVRTATQNQQSAGIIKSFLFYLQVTNLIVSEENWSGWLGQTLGIFDFANFTVIGPECYWSWFGTPLGSTLFQLGIMLLIILGSLILVAGNWIGSYILYRTGWQRKIDQLTNQLDVLWTCQSAKPILQIKSDHINWKMELFIQLVHTALFLVYSLYIEVATTTLDLLRPCQHDYNGSFLWISCFGEESWQLYSIGIFLIIVYVLGVPLLFLGLLLIQYYFRLDHHHWFSRISLFLQEGYKTRMNWFELTLMLRRIVISIAVTIIIPLDQSTASLIIILVLVGAILLQYLLKPFESREENDIEMHSLIVILVTYSVSLQENISILATVIVFILNLIYILEITVLLVISEPIKKLLIRMRPMIIITTELSGHEL